MNRKLTIGRQGDFSDSPEWKPPAGNLRDRWVQECWRLARTPAHLYSGARKIIRGVSLSFTLDDSLQLADAGYTGSKLTMLTKNYLHEESRKVAVQLWKKRRGQAKYGSVSFTTFNHFVKGGSINAKRSKRASVFGPCLQSVSITWIDKKTVGVDVFYRTTEVFKKFAPDLVFLRDVLLEPFNFGDSEVRVTIHFANVTIHPMYAVTIFPFLDDPVRRLNELRREDPYFYNWVIKWSARYLCDEFQRGITKFSQAMRVRADARKRIDRKTLGDLRIYLRKHHPGFRGDHHDTEEEDE